MRPYRGLTKDGKWVFGWYLPKCYTNLKNEIKIQHTIAVTHKDVGFTSYHEVIPSTVGQSTGLKDRNGKEIYEGDILRTVPQKGSCGIVSSVNGCSTFIRKVIWLENEARFGWELMDGSRNQSGYCLYAKDVFEIIGTIHDKEQP